MDRRSYLGKCGVGTLAFCSGCVTVLRDGFTDNSTSGEDTLPSSCPDPNADVGYRCGGGAPISASERFDDDDEVRVNENGTVDFVVGYVGGEPKYKSHAFEDWGRLVAADVGGQAAIETVRTTLDNTSGLASGIGGPGPRTGAQFTVYIGETAEDTPDPVHFDTVVNTAPAFVKTTIWLKEYEYYDDIPVYVDTTKYRSHDAK
ncbi:hypothetical protein ACFQJ7_05080 [Halovenus rubra]|uniref:Uncharacterized protein n=2 Tax=Halovenus rubra TaxID=869890 RepID=A0ACC7E155_9EURY|nr:hypothetical protein [Halovenus rubra]